MRTCKADGCHAQTKGYSSYCERHKRTMARHGHPHQTGVTKADLKPYIKAVRAFLERNHPGKAQTVIQGAWDRTVREARRFMDQAYQGRAQSVYDREAYQAVLSLAEEQDADTIGVLLIAMGYWYQDQPRFWRHDDGFRFQTVRMLLRLNPREAAYKWHDGKMERSVYRDVRPGTIRALWAIVHGTGFVGYGGEIAVREAAAREARQREVKRERAAFFGDDQNAEGAA
ncbi:hypothetical protein [Ollibium composti]|uniref:Uncharacterized protein n=1 Tax=Ollibium composti TaxID=2675109 RepID=A0ABY2QA58_9HYPH|nr:hypothetical protein [Mesorhizobium composti]THF58854.1 hypothetical protein E6C48_04150 [Mesorhizobium composti]